MTSLHMLGHMVSMAIVAALVKQIVQLNSQVNELKEEISKLHGQSNCDQCVKVAEGDERQDISPKDNEQKHILNNVLLSDGEHITIESSENPKDAAGKNEVMNNVFYENEKRHDEKNPSEKHGQENESFKHIDNKNKYKSVDSDTLKDEFQDFRESSQLADSLASKAQFSSSVMCYEGQNELCKFESICYSSRVQQFVIFVDESSIFDNALTKDGSVSVSLVSVPGHNAKSITIATLPSKVSGNIDIKWVNEMTLLFQRFLPDNFMHMFHDDLLPLHDTLQFVQSHHSWESNQPYNVKLFIFEEEDNQLSEIDKYYSIFSKHEIMFKSDFKDFPTDFTCFKSMFVGLSKTTLWYDYGFTQPQGPLANIKVKGSHIRRTAAFIKQNMPSNSRTVVASNYVVLFTRKENRKILNEIDLTLAIMKSTGIQVVSLDGAVHSLAEIISYVKNSMGVIGMHGSLLVLSMFLKPGSLVLELFPYAIKAEHYTPYKTLCEIDGMSLKYKSWTNQKQENSVGHPDWSDEIGGLSHLEEAAREAIQNQKEVPLHLCCSDPSWLYHIYQDTVTDINQVLAVLMEILSNSKLETEQNFIKPAVYPSKIINVSCVYTCRKGADLCNVSLTWETPWILEYVLYSDLQYDIILQDGQTGTNGNIKMWTVDINNFDVELPARSYLHLPQKFHVWIRGKFNDNINGPYSDSFLCNLG
ncbi:protein O-linked-mannose beta-1,4-N-acetylglucosaminyltransferase 2-like [Dreissena polymorpha]|uniref:Glycosyltransferase 61 catalytic domain-containing protein n=1 Tax=Dreissena polymorpha TaxID=45954 RepID=A0A9D4DYU3_DREPO|nr:protein O-linked-mannose beta-1,4-N-acetylglucosaminyltransferase 2-like [Dreissena polymorpha]KAH3768722.1 hypothetical protein DPMN_169939 [Dreissena polymorpha]